VAHVEVRFERFKWPEAEQQQRRLVIADKIRRHGGGGDLGRVEVERPPPKVEGLEHVVLREDGAVQHRDGGLF
jgi:hypothetical protein